MGRRVPKLFSTEGKIGFAEFLGGLVAAFILAGFITTVVAVTIGDMIGVMLFRITAENPTKTPQAKVLWNIYSAFQIATFLVPLLWSWSTLLVRFVRKPVTPANPSPIVP